VTPTWARVRADDNEIVSPRELRISSKMKLPNHELGLRRFGLISFGSKAIPALPAISYDGIGMIVITFMILEQAYGGTYRGILVVICTGRALSSFSAIAFPLIHPATSSSQFHSIYSAESASVVLV